jgi:catechol 2,3-dioxygenase-like lactoylglutathione lyase family enzyme
MRWAGLCLDCADAEELAAFYTRILGWAEQTRDDDGSWILLRDPGGGVTLSFQAEDWYRPPVWPEHPDAPSKMLHMEIEVDDVDAAVATVVAAGGRVAHSQPTDRDPQQLRVMLDPAGHPFCLCNDE